MKSHVPNRHSGLAGEKATKMTCPFQLSTAAFLIADMSIRYLPGMGRIGLDE